MTKETLATLLFILFSLAIATEDIKTGAVSRLAFMGAFPVFFAFVLLRSARHSLLAALTGAMVGLIAFLLAYFISAKKLGLADVWYSALIGMVLGPRNWYLAIGSACIGGIVYILVSKRQSIPFIPLMAIGSIVVGIIKGTSL